MVSSRCFHLRPCGAKAERLRLVFGLLGVFSVGIGLPSPSSAIPSARASTSVDLDDAYKTIRSEGAKIPIPTPHATAELGTFDAATGTFPGLDEVIDDTGRKPKKIVPVISINAVNALLTFRIANNAHRTVTGHIGPAGVFVPAGRASATVNVGRAHKISWSLTSGGKTARGQLNIVRPRLIGAGAFRVDALPIAVIYEPPQPADPTLQNDAVYTQGSEVGTSLRTSFTRSTGTTRFGASPGFEDTQMFADGLAKLGGLLEGSGDAKAKIAGKALKGISTALGSAQHSRESVDVSAHNSALEVSLSKESSCSTALQTGPGTGDVIVWLQDVRLAWFDNGEQTKLAFLGATGEACKPVSSLQIALERAHVRPGRPVRICFTKLRVCPREQGLMSTTVEGLLHLDPFVAGGPDVELPSHRFEKQPSIIAAVGAPQTKMVSIRVTKEDTQTSASTILTIDDLEKSFLSVLGVGPSETKRVATTVTIQSSTSFRNSNTIETTVHIEGPPPGTDTINMFFDRLFGTLALQSG